LVASDLCALICRSRFIEEYGTRIINTKQTDKVGFHFAFTISAFPYVYHLAHLFFAFYFPIITFYRKAHRVASIGSIGMNRVLEIRGISIAKIPIVLIYFGAWVSPGIACKSHITFFNLIAHFGLKIAWTILTIPYFNFFANSLFTHISTISSFYCKTYRVCSV